MNSIYHVIKRPLATEKSTLAQEKLNQVTFEVDRRANRVEIKQAVEALFNVQVAKVNTSILPGKPKRRGRTIVKTAPRKKAIVTLAAGQEIDLFEGM